jgi:hypothetical protein
MVSVIGQEEVKVWEKKRGDEKVVLIALLHLELMF